MSRVIIPKVGFGDYGKTGWILGKAVDKDGNLIGREALFRCGACNGTGNLKLHSIEPNGEVNASVLCPSNDYHEFVILADWPPEWRKAAGDEYITSTV